MKRSFLLSERGLWRLFAFVNLGMLALVVGYAVLYCCSERFGGGLFDCAFKETFRLYCPGCGGSRALMRLLRLDLRGAFRFCPFLPLAALLFLVNDVFLFVCAVRKDPVRFSGFPFAVWWCVPAAMLVQFVVRNALLVKFGFDPIGDILPH